MGALEHVSKEQPFEDKDHYYRFNTEVNTCQQFRPGNIFISLPTSLRSYYSKMSQSSYLLHKVKRFLVINCFIQLSILIS